MEHLAATKSLSERQYAYRPGRSTTDVGREVVRRVLEARECHQHVAVIFCDLTKAFDVTDHSVLSAKMKHYGIDGPALALLVDFITGRSQIVTGERGTIKSAPLTSNIGVAQGSSISNIMFSLLLNDLPDNIDEARVLMYADDVAAIVCSSTIEQLERKMGTVMDNLHKWFQQNGLMLNISKTQFMQFNISGRACKQIQVNLAKDIILGVDHATFLGFTLDRALTWEKHIDCVCKKIGRACFALWRLSATLPTEMVRSCYFASVQSVIQYGIELWGRAADWIRVFRMQKRAVRAMMRVSRLTSAQPYFRSLRILTVPSLVIFHSAMYARKNLNEYTKLGDRHNYNTRHAHQLSAVPRRLAKSSKLVHVMAPTVYNRLPDHVRDAPSTQSFKTRLKRWLIEQSFYHWDEFIG